MSEKSSSGLYLTVLFVLWYAFNAGFNVYNQSCARVFAYPLAISTLVLVVGLASALPLWILGIREAPRLGFTDICRILPIVLLNAVGHAATVIAMFEKGGGSFTHVIKASEPVVSAILGIFFTFVVPKPLTGLSLLPITYGVAYASTLGNLNIEVMKTEFATKAAIFAMTGNVAFAMRSIVRKGLDKEFKERTKLTPANDHAVTTILSAVLLAPFVYMYEDLGEMTAVYEGLDKQAFLVNLFACGMCFYVYNELQNIVLSSLGPVPTAVGNTLKRVVIFAALFFFTEGETFPTPKIVGCAIAVTGCLLFAIFDSMKI